MFGERVVYLNCVCTNLFLIRNDAKTVSIVALGCFHPNSKVQNASLHFFLGSEEEEDEESDEEASSFLE